MAQASDVACTSCTNESSCTHEVFSCTKCTLPAVQEVTASGVIRRESMVRYPPNWFTRLLCVLLVLAGGLLMATAGADTPQANGGFVAQIHLDDAVGPATAAYVHDAGKRAVDDGARAIILRLDTPGGLSKSMRAIVD